MLCPHCGAEALPGSRFCYRCRRRLAEPGPPAVPSFVYNAPKPPHAPARRGLAAAALLLALAGLGAGGWVLRERQRRTDAAASEGRALARLRAVMTAQMRYASVNGGAFDTLACLAGPERCLPRVSKDLAPFLAPEALSPEAQADYRLTLHAGPAPHEPRSPTQYSPSSLAAYACVAHPQPPGGALRRTFCGDSTGRLCVLSSPESPELADGVCPLLCTDLRLTPAPRQP